jgi:hypothetical protein
MRFIAAEGQGPCGSTLASTAKTTLERADKSLKDYVRRLIRRGEAPISARAARAAPAPSGAGVERRRLVLAAPITLRMRRS